MSDAAADSFIRRAGRQLIFTVYGALRAVKLYPPENDAVQKSLAELTNSTRELLGSEAELELKISGEFIFVNATRLRLDLDNFASFSHLLSLFRATGIGTLTIGQGVGPKDWLIFLALLQAAGPDDPAERLAQVTEKLAQAGVTVFTFAPPAELGADSREKAKERAKRTYAHSVAATRDLMSSIRMGTSPNIKKIKRVIQGIVDQILHGKHRAVRVVPW